MRPVKKGGLGTYGGGDGGKKVLKIFVFEKTLRVKFLNLPLTDYGFCSGKRRKFSSETYFAPVF